MVSRASLLAWMVSGRRAVQGSTAFPAAGRPSPRRRSWTYRFHGHRHQKVQFGAHGRFGGNTGGHEFSMMPEQFGELPFDFRRGVQACQNSMASNGRLTQSSHPWKARSWPPAPPGIDTMTGMVSVRDVLDSCSNSISLASDRTHRPDGCGVIGDSVAGRRQPEAM